MAVSIATLFMSLGEELSKRFLPKYLEALCAPVVAIGLYGSARDALDGCYQYPGGWIADRFGRRRALLFFLGLAALGYTVYLLARTWVFVFCGLVLVMAWSAMASPALFAVIGDALPKGQRAMGFTLQSILRRIPMAVAPALGGVAIASYGVITGVRLGLGFTLLLVALTAWVVWRVNAQLGTTDAPTTNVRGVWRSFPASLRWLLVSDIFVRTCEGMVDVFIVLYATNVIGVSATQFGLLVGVQMTTSLLVYLPAARMADRFGRKPFVILTFLAFSAFPLAVAAARTWPALLFAFVVGGLRELGEPARKALIVDFAEPHVRGRSVGLYYFLRSTAITPAAFIGSMLWQFAPRLPFLAAALVGVVGTVIFALTVDERHAG
jgi:MFS family permease